LEFLKASLPLSKAHDWFADGGQITVKATRIFTILVGAYSNGGYCDKVKKKRITIKQLPDLKVLG